MLLAASESAVTKKPRLRLTMRRSSSVRPFGSFHNAMSRVMFTSCGIQWLAQVARYFSQAHLYLNGTSWLTSVWPLMIRLSEALTRWPAAAATGAVAVAGCASDEVGAATARPAERPPVDAWCCCNPCCISFGKEGLTSSSQVNIEKSNAQLSEQRCELQSARSHRAPFMGLLCCSHASRDVSQCLD
ncbi:hypothetical protein D3C72_1037060 [compost metagenome]